MGFLENIIRERSTPEIMLFKNGRRVKCLNDFIKRRDEIKKLLSENVYGYIPSPAEKFKAELISRDQSFCAGKATLSKFNLIVTVNGNDFSFPFAATIPKEASKENKAAAFVHVNFRPDTPDKYMPLEEIVDNGFAVFSFCYDDITKDDNNFRDKLCKILGINRRKKSAPGKIAIWAWAAMRVMDYTETLDCIDLENIAVVGHSRLGKTALLAGAFDERFKYVISNDSGCAGAALTRGKIGENIALITGVKACWFCPRYSEYASNDKGLPLDQHFLLALAAPRFLLVGSAKEDLWADPASEFLSAYLASSAYKMYGMRGLICENQIPEANSTLDEGEICYHIREGKHYFSRYDWNIYMTYMKKQIYKS